MKEAIAILDLAGKILGISEAAIRNSLGLLNVRGNFSVDEPFLFPSLWRCKLWKQTIEK